MLATVCRMTTHVDDIIHHLISSHLPAKSFQTFCRLVPDTRHIGRAIVESVLDTGVWCSVVGIVSTSIRVIVDIRWIVASYGLVSHLLTKSRIEMHFTILFLTITISYIVSIVQCTMYNKCRDLIV